MGIGGGGTGGVAGPPRRAHAPGFVFDKQRKWDMLQADTEQDFLDDEGNEDGGNRSAAEFAFSEIDQERGRAQKKFDDEYWATKDAEQAKADAKKDGLPDQVNIDNPEIQKARDEEKADAAAAVGRDDTIIAKPVVVDSGAGVNMPGGTNDMVAVAGGRGTETGARAPVVRDPESGRGTPADAAGGGRNVGFGTSDPDRGQGRVGRGRGRDQRTGVWRRPPRGGRGRPWRDKALIVDTGVVTTGKTLLGQ